MDTADYHMLTRELKQMTERIDKLESLLLKHLNDKEYQVLRLSYGLDCDKHTAKQIAVILNITGASDYVRVSELKKQAINKLIESVDHSQVLDYL